MANLFHPSRLRPARGYAALLLTGSLLVLLSAVAAPAGAVLAEVGSTKVGLQPRAESIPTWAKGNLLGADDFANPSGYSIVNTNKTYAIYWDPTDHYHGDWQEVIDTFFQSMGAASGSLASVFSVDTQYTDAANQHALYESTFHGAYTDTDAYPTSGCKDPHPLEAADLVGPIVAKVHTPVCLTDTQVREELEQYISQHSLQKGMGSIFYVLTPPAVTVCLDAGGPTGHCSDYENTLGSYEHSFCSYHSAISPTNPVNGDENTILYGVVPWIAGGLADGHLSIADQVTPAYDCQDGGFDASSTKPVEKREEKKEVRKNQKKEEEEPLTKEEQEEQELVEALEGPHQQEPNQKPCPSPDGYCDTGLADLIVNQIGVEQQNIVTDPLLDAWQGTETHKEATDECRDYFAPTLGGSVTASTETGGGTLYNQSLGGGNYYLNDAFNLSSLRLPYPSVGCLPGIRLEPQFTAPNPVNANELVSFDGMESDISLNAGTFYPAVGSPEVLYANYKWNFGDGSPEVSGYAPGAPTVNPPEASSCTAPWETPCAASIFHSYQYGGTYQVTLTVTDAGGNVASITHPVTVAGPPTPSPEPSGGAGAGGGSGGSTGSGASVVGPSSSSGHASSGNQAGAGSGGTLPPPALTASVPSKALKKATQKGLAVNYSVNEQVAGSLQVLLESAKAKQLGISGPTATGLPAGSPRSIVIGTAVLVATKAGKGTIHIKFSSRIAKRLGRMHKVKLTLRLVARNASRQSPLSTTLLSTVVLNG